MREGLITQLEAFESQRRLLKSNNPCQFSISKYSWTPSPFIKRWAEDGHLLMSLQINKATYEIPHR